MKKALIYTTLLTSLLGCGGGGGGGSTPNNNEQENPNKPKIKIHSIQEIEQIIQNELNCLPNQKTVKSTPINYSHNQNIPVNLICDDNQFRFGIKIFDKEKTTEEKANESQINSLNQNLSTRSPDYSNVNKVIKLDLSQIQYQSQILEKISQAQQTAKPVLEKPINGLEEQIKHLGLTTQDLESSQIKLSRDLYGQVYSEKLNQTCQDLKNCKLNSWAVETLKTNPFGSYKSKVILSNKNGTVQYTKTLYY